MSEYIFLVQIGPVQSFIAAARKVQDLAVGSRLLSNLAASGVEAAEKVGANMLFPMRIDEKLPESVPHRFAFTSSAEPEAITGKIIQEIEEKWYAYASAVRDQVLEKVGNDGNWTSVFDEQIKQWMQITWAAVPYDAHKHGESYKLVNQALASRKQFREFEQVNESGDADGIKCTLTGSQSALNVDWQKLEKSLRYEEGVLFRPAEKLGSLALIKRILPTAHSDFEKFKRYPDIESIAGVPEDNPEGREMDRYFAVLHMDGDKMGTALSKLTMREQHQEFSQLLAGFADWVTDQYPVTRNSRIVPIYAGGDDVLALLPVEQVLDYAEHIRTEFSIHMQKYGLHASAGIAISYYKSPLSIALETSRQAEKNAKQEFGRNAVTIRETTHSGSIRDASGKWVDGKPGSTQISFIALMEQLRASMKTGDISTKLGFDLRQLHHDMVETDETSISELLKSARAEEVKRILKRRLSDQLPKQQKLALIKSMSEQFVQLGESPNCGWDSLANRVIMARFMAQEDT